MQKNIYSKINILLIMDFEIGDIFIHITNDKRIIYVKLIRLRQSNINTFVEIDENFEPIKIKRKWSVRKETQEHSIKGFDNLYNVIFI